MKTKMKNVLLSLLMMVSIATTAGTRDFSLTLEKSMGKTVRFTVTNAGEPLTIRVKNTDGLVIYSDDTKEVTFRKNYDFKGMPDGSYTIEVEGENKIEKVEVMVAQELDQLAPSVLSTIYKPYVRRKDNLVSVDMLRVDNAPMKVSVYDEANVLLYTETLLDKSGKQFDFSNVRKGEYTILIQHKGKTFQENFIK